VIRQKFIVRETDFISDRAAMHRAMELNKEAGIVKPPFKFWGISGARGTNFEHSHFVGEVVEVNE